MTEHNQQPPSHQAIPPQGYYAQQPYHADDEIDLRELFSVLWNGKWWIIGITALFAIASVFYALSLPNEYKATAIVAPAASDSSGGLGNLAGQFGGLASIAGINLGGSESNDATIALEIMKTWGFQEEFIKKHNLEVAIFAAKGWNQSTNELIIDDELFDESVRKWIREAPKGKTVEPTSWELHEEFAENLLISEDKDTGFVRISFIHYKPETAKSIAALMVQDINKLMKQRALSDADKNIAYLESQISSTSLSGMQEVFYSLVEEQIKTKMLADVNDEFAFKVLSEPKLPEEKVAPKRGILVLAITIVGMLLSSLFVVFFSLIGVSKK